MSVELVDNTNERAARGALFRLLGRIWLREVDQNLIEEITQGRLREPFRKCGGTPIDESVDELAVEYCRLFVGPAKHLPPYQSVWESGQLESRVTSSMRQFIDLVGFQSDRSSSLVDHLGTQLQVMGHILQLPDRATPTDINEELRQVYFWRHLRWPARLLELAEQHTASSFYQSVIRITRDFLRSEQEQVTGVESTAGEQARAEE